MSINVYSTLMYANYSRLQNYCLQTITKCMCRLQTDNTCTTNDHNSTNMLISCTYLIVWYDTWYRVLTWLNWVCFFNLNAIVKLWLLYSLLLLLLLLLCPSFFFFFFIVIFSKKHGQFTTKDTLVPLRRPHMRLGRAKVLRSLSYYLRGGKASDTTLSITRRRWA